MYGKQKRREFLKQSVIAGTGLALAGTSRAATGQTQKQDQAWGTAFIRLYKIIRDYS